MNPNIQRILVVSFDGKKLFFCSVDESRVVFFDDVSYGILASVTNKETVISLFRGGKEFDNGTPFLIQGQIESLQFSGFELLKKEAKVSNKDWQTNLSQHKLPAAYFAEGDVIEIDKDWKNFEEPEKWLSLISTYRSYGAIFIDIESQNSSHVTLKKIIDFFDLKLEDISTKKDIFTSTPSIASLNEYY